MTVRLQSLRLLVAVSVAVVAFLLTWGLATASAQAAQQPDQGPAPNSAPSPRVTVHGLVRNGTSGEPLPRALVRIDGDAFTGTLTDGEGRFELPDVPVGPQSFAIKKPGFGDQSSVPGSVGRWANRDFGHNVIVVAEMPDVVFTLTPVNSIRGQIQLSTGDPSQGIVVTLLTRVVQDGRAVWQAANSARTNSEGVYRFGNLADGSYALYTGPTMESESATSLIEAGIAANIARSGYASVFYPESRDLAAAAKIRLAGGEQAEANFSLVSEPFHAVAATVTFPHAGAAVDQVATMVSVLVLDAQGHQLPYNTQYDADAHTVQTLLPDGNYEFVVIATTSRSSGSAVGGIQTLTAPNGASQTGQAGFAVAGRAVTNVRVPLAQAHASPVQMTLAQSAPPSTPGVGSEIFITLSQTGGWVADGMVTSYAQGNTAGTLAASFVTPGAYWVHTSIAQRNLCEGAFTAGGASLAREPLVLGLSGATAPLTLVLREDCASLTLSLPASIAGIIAGEERAVTVYAVPDFDSTADVVSQTLRPSTGGTITLTGLTPGPYHVYAFSQPVALEYRNPSVMAALRNAGQAVTLAPGAKTDLIVEAPQP